MNPIPQPISVSLAAMAHESLEPVPRRKPGKSGVPGVSPRGDRWEVRCKLDNVMHYLGKYNTIDQAREAKEAFLRGDPVNKPSLSKSGATGVRDKGNKFQVEVMRKGIKHQLGRFPTLEAGIAARAAFLRGEEVVKPEWDKPNVGKSGVVGVYQRKERREKFEAQVKQNGKAHYIGTFPTLEEASEARDAFLRGEVVINPSSKRGSSSCLPPGSILESAENQPSKRKKSSHNPNLVPLAQVLDQPVNPVSAEQLVPSTGPGGIPMMAVAPIPMALSMMMVPVQAPDLTGLAAGIIDNNNAANGGL